MNINSKLQNLRKIIRGNSKIIINHIADNYIKRDRDKAVKPWMNICVFCGSSEKISKEHVLPRWVFERSTERFFINDINWMAQTYNKTTVPTCAKCNNDLLGNLEKYIINLLKTTNLQETYFQDEEKENIIRWLEIIDFKFEIYNAIKRFNASKESGYIPYLADFPLTTLRKNGPETPSQVITEIRRTQKRLILKNKKKNINSLVVFKTKNKGFHFFHQMDEFIFVELPQCWIALFYFYKKIFENEKDGYTKSKEIINKIY
jgi:hypothetical protein